MFTWAKQPMSSPKSETPQTSDTCIIPAKNLNLHLFCDDCRCSFQCRPNFCGFHVCHHISHPASLTNPRGVSESAWLFRWGSGGGGHIRGGYRIPRPTLARMFSQTWMLTFQLLVVSLVSETQGPQPHGRQLATEAG